MGRLRELLLAERREVLMDAFRFLHKVDFPAPGQQELHRLVANARRPVDKFVRRAGDGDNAAQVHGNPEHEDMQELLVAMEELDAGVQSAQQRALVQLQAEVLRSVRGVAEVFGSSSLPKPSTSFTDERELNELPAQLEALEKATMRVNVDAARGTEP